MTLLREVGRVPSGVKRSEKPDILLNEINCRVFHSTGSRSEPDLHMARSYSLAMIYKTFIIMILGIILFLNCDLFNFSKFSEAIEKNELYGVYRANFKDILDYIELRSDTTYLHYTIFPDGQERSDSGLWSFRSNSFNIIPYVSSDYIRTAHWSAMGDCKDNELTLFEFLRTPYIIPGYEETPQLPGTKNKHIWKTCLFKKEGLIKIKFDPTFGLYYIKTDSIIK